MPSRRYLLHCIDLLEGLLGFGLGTFCALEGCGKLRLSRLRVKVQRLVLRHESLELLMHLAHTSLLLFPLGALLGRFIFGLGLLTFVLLELPLGKAEFSLGPFEVLLQCGDLRSQCG